MRMLKDRHVLLIVGGGIAAYKAPLVVRALTGLGAEVRCVLTPAATHFVTPLTLQTVSGHRVGVEVMDAEFESQIGHIELARWADVVLIAPATANLIARLAAGIANDLATTLVLATTAPILVAPAMNTQMLLHPATARNIETLREFGYTIIPPEEGDLACGEAGPGRMPDPEALVEAIGMRLAPKPLLGKLVLVTAGPTRAFLDPVRFVSNPSSGRMGIAMARAAAWLGASVTLVKGPGVQVPPGIPLAAQVTVETAEEMADAVLNRLTALDWLFMVAAVSDWEAAELLQEKHKKDADDNDERWLLELRRTTDILKEAGARRNALDRERPLHLVGFAAETHALEEHAMAKLESKGVDAILANWVRSSKGDTFGSDDVHLVAFGANGWREEFGPDNKSAVALDVVQALVERLNAKDN